MRTAAREQPEVALSLSELPPLERNRVSWMTAGPDSPVCTFVPGRSGAEVLTIMHGQGRHLELHALVTGS